MSLDVSLGFGAIGGAAGVIVILLFLWVVNNPEKAERIASWLWRGLSWTRLALVEYRRIATAIQATINTAYKNLNNEAPDALTYPVKLQWVRNAEQAQTILKEGECIVRIKASGDPDRDFTTVSLAYVQKTLLLNARPLLDANLRTALDYHVVTRILHRAPAQGAMGFFLSQVLEPATHQNHVLKSDLFVVRRLDEAGWLSRVVMYELSRAARSLLAEEIPRLGLESEVRGFVRFVYEIASKEKGEEPDLLFGGSQLRIAFILLAKPSTVQLWGLDAHVRRLGRDLREGAEVVYLAGIGDHNIERARAVARQAQKNGWVLVEREHTYARPKSGSFARAICIVCQRVSVPATVSTDPDLTDEVRRAFEEEVPEIADGRVTIVKIARDPKVRTKVAVRSFEVDLHPVGACLGEGGERIRAVRAHIGNEPIDVVMWDEDIGCFLRNALYPLPKDGITRVLMHADRHEVKVYVRNDLMSQAIGPAGTNVRLASRLTGLRITVLPQEGGD